MKVCLYWRYTFYISIVLLINFVVFKFSGDIGAVKNRIQSGYENVQMGRSNLNLVPFRNIFSYGSDLSTGFAFINIAGNILPFIPLGFLIPLVFTTRRSFPQTMTICLMVIICIEIVQFFTYLGSMDIDDVILNQISCMLGTYVI